MTQVHVIGSIGYVANEQGLSKYAQDLQACLQKADSDVQQVLTDIRRDTWREMVATAFALDVADIPTLSIVDARNHMHKVASKMMEPSVLLEIQTKTSKINSESKNIIILFGAYFLRIKLSYLLLSLQTMTPKLNCNSSTRYSKMSLLIKYILEAVPAWWKN